MGKIAFVFSGQGAQYPGLGSDLYKEYSCVKDVYSHAEESVLKVCFEGPQELLNNTEYTQACMYLSGLAAAATLQEHGIQADVAAGFSVGEITALAYAEMFTQSFGYHLINNRAQWMQQCATKHPGVMYALLGKEDDYVREFCSSIQDCYPVNFNCPGQITVSMPVQSEQEFLARTKQEGIKAIKLKVSGAFHTKFMKEASDKLHEFLCENRFNDTDLTNKTPVYSNVTAKTYSGDIAKLLSEQASSSVLWSKSVENMIKDGVNIFIELGAKAVLSNMIKRINKEVAVYNVYDLQTLNEVLEVFNVKR